MIRIAAMFITIAAATATGQPYPPLPDSRVDITFNRFYDYDETTAILKQFADKYPKLVKLESIGQSHEGREMWLATVTNFATGSDRDKPTMYIDANVHGNEVQGTETCLYTIWYLTRLHGHNEKISELLDERAFYIIPMVNPDGRAFWFREPNTPHSSRTGHRPTDNDSDGLKDEDGPDDLDGDGFITGMWQKDPNGRWRQSKKDPRLFERVPRHEKGDYNYLGGEGIDNDGDGRINEDGSGGYDMNRNWPSDWQPPYIQYGAGDFPFCFPETRCIGEFLVDRPNVAAIQSYHNSAGMVLRGPGRKGRESAYPRADVRVYDRLGETGENVIPFYRYVVLYQDLYDVYGGFVTWGYEGLGVFSFTNELWAASQYYADSREDWFRITNEDRLKFADLLEFGETYRPLKPYNHPTYGDIEIGGFTQYAFRVPPTFMLEELCHRNTAFTLYHADQMPMLKFMNVDVASIGDDTWEVTVEIENERLIPSISRRAADQKIGPRDALTLVGDSATVVASGTLANKHLASVMLTKHNPQRIWVDRGIGSHATRLFRFIVTGSGEVTLTYKSAKARDIKTAVDLK